MTAFVLGNTCLRGKARIAPPPRQQSACRLVPVRPKSQRGRRLDRCSGRCVDFVLVMRVVMRL
jgi:hypothetical protein